MTISVIQAVDKSTLSSTITAVTAKSGLIVCINSFKSSGTPSVSGVTIGGHAMTQACSAINPSSGDSSTWIYYLLNMIGSETALVISGSNLQVDAIDGGVDIIEAAGLGTDMNTSTGTLDKKIATTGNGTAWSSGSSGSLASTDELVIGSASTASSSHPSGWTNISGGSFRETGYQIVTAATAKTFSGTNGSSTNWCAALASFKAANVAKNAAAAAIASML